MAKHGKKYTDIAKKAPTDVVSLEEAVAFLKAHPVAKFDETAEIAFRMGCNPKQQTIRGTVNLPNGTGKKVRVLVFAQGTAADAAREAGADHVGLDDLLEKIKGGWLDFDVAIATPDTMASVRKMARVLGPRGLMPNPRTGTVTEDTAAAVKASKAGKVEFRMNQQAAICVPFGKASFEVPALVENAMAIRDAIVAERPAAVKGQYIRRVTVSSTMGVGIRVTIKE
jgi:large subunit ribosomal protein L1